MVLQDQTLKGRDNPDGTDNERVIVRSEVPAGEIWYIEDVRANLVESGTNLSDDFKFQMRVGLVPSFLTNAQLESSNTRMQSMLGHQRYRLGTNLGSGVGELKAGPNAIDQMISGGTDIAIQTTKQEASSQGVMELVVRARQIL